MPEGGKFSVGDYVSIPGRVVKTDYVGQRLDRCVKVETETGTQEWFRADDLIREQVPCRHDARVARCRSCTDAASGARVPRSWSLPAPPPDDVTVVHGRDADDEPVVFARIPEDEAGPDAWRERSNGDVVSWSAVLDWSPVVEGEPPAAAPKFKRGFYRLTQDLEVGPDIVAGGSLVFLASVETPSREHGSVHAESALARVKLADLAAAGAERVEDR